MANLVRNSVSRRRFLKGVGATAGTLALSGTFGHRAFSQLPPVVKVGTLFAFTGALSEFGPNFANAADLAARHINDAANQAFGGPIINLIHEDSGTAPSQGVDRAQKLVNVDRVPAVIGALSSGVSSAVAESVTIPAEVLQISPASTSPIFSASPFDETWFRTTASDALQGVVAAMLARGEIVSEYKQDTASAMFVNNPYGQGLKDVFQRAFEARGGTFLAAVPHASEPKPTYVEDLDKALADDPDIVFTPSYPGASTVYMVEALEQFNFTSFQHTDGTKSEENIKALGIENLDGQFGTAPGSNPDRAGFQTFQQAYAETFGRTPPLPFMDSAYDATIIAGLTVAKAIADGLSKDEITGPALIERIRQVSNPPGATVGVGAEEAVLALRLISDETDIDYAGAAGEQDFDEVGDVITPVEVWKYSAEAGGIQSVQTILEVPAE